MNYPAAPMSGIYASLRQATGYQAGIILTPQETGNETFTRLRRACPVSGFNILPFPLFFRINTLCPQ